jgi:hypothetical protein
MANPIPGAFLAIVSASLLALALPCPLDAARVEFAADVPLVESDGMPCVEARIGDGPPVLFAIDTGDISNTLNAGAAKAAGLTPVAIPPPAPAGYFEAAIPVLHIGALTFKGMHALVLDFAKNQMPPGLAGTLAYSDFKDRILQVDYVARRVRISAVLTATAEIAGPQSTYSLITFGDKGPPIVVAKGFEVGGKPITAQVDTMYTGSLLIYTRSITGLGLGEVAAAATPEFFPFTDGGVTMKGAPGPMESFLGTPLGPAQPRLYFPTPGVHEPDGLFDATVGLTLLRDAVLTLDFHDGTISVTRPRA